MREIKKSVNLTNNTMICNHNLSNGHLKKISYNSKITTRINNRLLDTLKNIVISDKLGGNYKYVTISDIIRNALEAYKNGMSLISQHERIGLYQETSFRVSDELKNFYMTLPNNAKNEILERSIITYIQHKL
jgi:Holliday junction resolvasome RuvABC ATP-dependent DNA helicase subunit